MWLGLLIFLLRGRRLLLLGVGLLWRFGLGFLGLRGRHFGFGCGGGIGLALGGLRWRRGDGWLGRSSSGAAVGENHAFQFAGIMLGVEHDEVEAGSVEQRDQGFAKRLRGDADDDLFLTASGRDGDLRAGLAFDLVEDLGQAYVIGAYAKASIFVLLSDNTMIDIDTKRDIEVLAKYESKTSAALNYVKQATTGSRIFI